MNTQKYLITSIAASVYFMAYGFLVYAVLLADYLAELMPAGSISPESEQNVVYIAIGCLFLGFVLTYMFIKGLEHRGTTEGLRFGLLIGLVFMGVYLIEAGTSPTTFQTALIFGLMDIIMYMGGGLIIALLYKE